MSWSRWNPLGSGWSSWGTQQQQQQHQHQHATDASPTPTSATTPSYTYEVRPRTTGTHHRSHHGSVSSPRSSAASLGRGSQTRDRDDIIVKYKSTQYPISFRAWSVDDGALLVGDVRNEVARLFKDVSPSSVRLIIKGKRLDDDKTSMRDAGFRSERPEVILCTIAEGPAFNRPAGTSASHEADEEEDEDGSGSDEDEDEDDDERSRTSSAANGTGKSKRKSRSRKKKRKAKSSTTPSATSSSSALPYPTGKTTEYLPMPGSSHPLHRTSTAAGGHSPSATPSAPSPRTAGQTPPQSSPKPQSSATSSISGLGTGPLSKLEVIASRFHVEIVPKVVQFFASPPSEKAKRDFEKKKWTETIEREVVLKYDAVELDGDPEARARRKELIKEAQAMLTRLDETS